MRSVDRRSNGTSKIDAIVSLVSELAVDLWVLPKALRDQWFSRNRREYHNKDGILNGMEIQDYMADLFPEEREQVAEFLRHYEFSDETIERAFRMMIAGATAKFSLETDIFVGEEASQYDLENYSNASQNRVKELLQFYVTERKAEMINVARLQDMEPTEHELIELTIIQLDKELKKRNDES